MRILNFKYTNKKTIAVLESKKGTIFEVNFSIDGLDVYLPGELTCPDKAKDFIKDFLISKEVLDFYYSWSKNLSEAQKWLGEKVNKNLFELEKGEKYTYFNPGRYKKQKAVYRPYY